MTWDHGWKCKGGWKDGWMEGRGIFQFAGIALVSRHRADCPVGKGVDWDANEKTAWLAEDGVY